MVEYTMNLDDVFGSLSDPIRRDILQRVSIRELSVSQIASVYDVSLAAISKHLKVLEKAKLIYKRKEGKQQIVSLSPTAFKDASEYLKHYEKLWIERFDALDAYLKEEEHGRN
jgi:DNA-binding transcriptional ArsR family regulator